MSHEFTISVFYMLEIDVSDDAIVFLCQNTHLLSYIDFSPNLSTLPVRFLMPIFILSAHNLGIRGMEPLVLLAGK